MSLRALFLLLLAAPAWALELPRIHLSYFRSAEASGCPAEDVLRLRVAGRLGYDPFLEDASRRVRLDITRRGEELVARLAQAEGGSRELRSRSASCEELSASIELSLALLIDPTGRAAQQARELAPPPPPPPVELPQEKAVDPPPPEPSLPSPPPWRVEAAAGAALLQGAGPSLMWGPQVALRAAPNPHFSTQVEGLFLVPSRAALSAGQVVSSGAQLELNACAHFAIFGLCAGGNAGLLWFEGEQLAQNRRGAAWRANVLLKAEAQWEFSPPFALRAGLGAHYALIRNTLEVGDQPVWTSPALGAQGTLSVVRSF